MNLQDGLRALAARPVPQAPWDFEHFEQRRHRQGRQRRAAVWSAALSVVALALVSGVAVLTQPAPTRLAALVPQAAGAQMADVQALQPPAPAMIDMSQFDITSSLEDHIALLDDELSAARAQQVPEAQLRPVESAREQLSATLQRVSYAHALLSL
jgi:hypothetical protein